MFGVVLELSGRPRSSQWAEKDRRLRPGFLGPRFVPARLPEETDHRLPIGTLRPMRPSWMPKYFAGILRVWDEGSISKPAGSDETDLRPGAAFRLLQPEEKHYEREETLHHWCGNTFLSTSDRKPRAQS